VSVSQREMDALRDRVTKAVGSLFEIEAEIGRGGMAVVYRARDVRLRRRVALKVLPPELAFRDDVKSRFLREAQMAAQLSHPNIVPIYAVDELDGVVFFAMGLVEGETLAQQLAREPRPSVGRVREILREVADALAYAHARQVVHRDVKPDNILVQRADGHTLVSDFGIARAAEGDSRLTVTGIAVGTPAYMSPEQAMGEREVDGRSDIYSLGIVGYQMLAGGLPFEASNTPAMLMKHISERPRPLHEVRPDLPANLVYAIERAMGKGRDERWRDALAFRDALDEHAAPGRASKAHPATAGLDDSGERSRHHAPAPRDPREPAGPQHGGLAQYPKFPPLPPNWMFRADTREYGKEALRDWREQQRIWKERVREKRNELAEDRTSRREERRAARGESRGLERSPEEKIRRVQRFAVSSVLIVGFLFLMNAATAGFPWVIFPAMGFGIGLVSRLSALWIDGIPLRRLFSRQPPTEFPPVLGAPATPALRIGQRSAREAEAPPAALAGDVRGIPREVLAGPHGAAVRDAADAKAVIVDVLKKLPEADRQLLPQEITPTVDALVERVNSLAQSLHQLDSDASVSAIDKLEHRIADLRASPTTTSGSERMLELLDRQLSTLKDLSGRREMVARELEKATTVLQTMRLDMLKLRSSGLDAKLDASRGATQEARALSNDIGRVIEAANEVRKL